MALQNKATHMINVAMMRDRITAGVPVMNRSIRHCCLHEPYQTTAAPSNDERLSVPDGFAQ